jgi:hypothetical protein
MVIALLETDAKYFGSKCHFQQLYVVNKRPLTELCAPLAICSQKANSCTRWRFSFHGLLLMLSIGHGQMNYIETEP